MLSVKLKRFISQSFILVVSTSNTKGIRASSQLRNHFLMKKKIRLEVYFYFGTSLNMAQQN